MKNYAKELWGLFDQWREQREFAAMIAWRRAHPTMLVREPPSPSPQQGQDSETEPLSVLNTRPLFAFLEEKNRGQDTHSAMRRAIQSAAMARKKG